MNINDITPEQLAALSNEELKKLCAPLFPAVRKAVLPEERHHKISTADRMMKSVLAQNKDLIAQMKAARDKMK